MKINDKTMKKPRPFDPYALLVCQFRRTILQRLEPIGPKGGPMGPKKGPKKGAQRKGTIFIDGPSMIIIDGNPLIFIDGYPLIFIDIH